jgi:hypothetical protein
MQKIVDASKKLVKELKDGTNTGFLKQCIDFRLEKTNGGQKYVIGNYPFPTEKI